MKSIIKLSLVVVLFCSTSFADDGSMGHGGKTCTGTNCLIENQEIDTNNTDQKQSDNSVLEFVKDYLISIFG